MKKIFKYMGLVGILVSIFACSESEIQPYSGTDSIYFTYVEYGNNAFGQPVGSPFDSLEVSFAYELPEVVEMPLKIPVAVQGQIVDYDRTYSVQATNESNAQEGVHYTLDKQQVLKANGRLDSLEITLLRTPEMKTDTISLTLELLPTDDFEVRMKEEVINKITGETWNYNKFSLHITDIISKPRGWFDYYLGDFTVKKFYLMCELLGLEPSMFNDRIPYGDTQYYGAFVQRYLDEQEAAGNTIYEEDGTPMIMGPGVQ